jgi:hypothetical protein
MHTSSGLLQRSPDRTPPPVPYIFASGRGSEGGSRKSASLPRAAGPGEDLPYKVELWDEAQQGVEQLLAVTASGSIGYAAYYGATREFPDRLITLRHRDRVIARWNEADR